MKHTIAHDLMTRLIRKYGNFSRASRILGEPILERAWAAKLDDDDIDRIETKMQYIPDQIEETELTEQDFNDVFTCLQGKFYGYISIMADYCDVDRQVVVRLVKRQGRLKSKQVMKVLKIVNGFKDE